MKNKIQLIKSLSKRAALVAIAAFLLAFTPIKVNAAVEDFIDTYAGNDIMFYNPSECEGEESSKELSTMSRDDLPAETKAKLAHIDDLANQNKSVYEEAAKSTKLPWQVLAAIHYREAGMSPNHSMTNGAPLGSGENVDGLVVGTTQLEDAILAGNHLVDMAKSVYNVVLGDEPSMEDLAYAFLSYNRGSMYKYGNATYDQSPYVMNFFDSSHMNMKWIHADSFSNGKKLNNLEGQQDGNVGALAVYVYLGGAVAGGSSAGTSNSEGLNVSVIGDDLIYAAKMSYPGHGFDANLKKANVQTQIGERIFTAEGAQTGEEQLDILVRQGTLRDVLVFSFGTNDIDAFDSEDLKTRIINKAEKAQKIILITNYDAKNPTKYDNNNKIFQQVAAENSKVSIADWEASVKANTGLVKEEDGVAITPTEAGVDELMRLLVNAIGVDLYGTSDDRFCACSTNTGTVEGGLTEEQAERLIDHYKKGTYDDDYTMIIKKANCVNMTAFFLRVFTSAGKNGGFFPNGKDVAHANATTLDLEEGKAPQPFSIFSVTHGSLICEDGYACGHTGVVVGVQGDDIITIEASYDEPDKTGVYHRSKDYFVNAKYGDSFVYLAPILDLEKLADAVDGMVNVGKTSKIVVNGQWKDGWLMSGIQGYVKESAISAQSNGKIKIADNSHDGNFVSISSNGEAKANKIMLMATEKVDAANVWNAYDAASAKPAHFTVDLKNKKTYQHLPITKPADAAAPHNDQAGIQVNIMGYSSGQFLGGHSDWVLTDTTKFGDGEWAYLATLMAAISHELGIDLSSGVNWEEPTRVAADKFAETTGIVGHMHMPDTDHLGPGNIWPMLSRSLGLMSNGVKCNNSYTGDDFPWYGQCDDRWANVVFGVSNVCKAGCGPTSFAMMATVLLKTEVLPDDTATYASKAGATSPTGGSAFQITKVLADKYDLEYELVPANDSTPDSEVIEIINKHLREGWMLHSSGSGTEPYTKGGHLVGIRGITNDGMWLIADSKKNGKANTLEKTWKPEDILSAGLKKGKLRFIRKK